MAISSKKPQRWLPSGLQGKSTTLGGERRDQPRLAETWIGSSRAVDDEKHGSPTTDQKYGRASKTQRVRKVSHAPQTPGDDYRKQSAFEIKSAPWRRRGDTGIFLGRWNLISDFCREDWDGLVRQSILKKGGVPGRPRVLRCGWLGLGRALDSAKRHGQHTTHGQRNEARQVHARCSSQPVHGLGTLTRYSLIQGTHNASKRYPICCPVMCWQSIRLSRFG